MGKSSQGKSEEAMRQYGDPAYQASGEQAKLFGQRAGRAQDIYYGKQPSGIGSQGQQATPSRAKPRGATAIKGKGYTRGIGVGPSEGTGPSAGREVNYDRAYEVYRWWVDEAGSDPSRLREKTWNMGDAEFALLDELAAKGGKFQPAFDYREAQKSGASAQELAKFAPDNVGVSGYSGTPVTSAQMESQGIFDTNTGGVGGVAGQSIRDYGGLQGEFGDLLGRYQEFADTGGYSPEDLASIRSRAVSPIRAAYSDVNRAIDRSRSLQGDYAPGYAATKAKVGREQAYTAADATTNVEAALAQMKQQGRLAGMGGMRSVLGGKAGLYGTTPGLASMFGQQALAAGGQQLQAQALQNQMGLGMMGARNQASNQPGWFDTVMGGASKVGGALYPWL